MPESKHMKWNHGFGTNAEQEAKAKDTMVAANDPVANDTDGWQQYRRWITKAPAPAPRTRRASIDPSLYTWKGYRNWTDQVRRNWTKESDDESE